MKIYRLINGNTNEVFYVGRTSLSLKARLDQHLSMINAKDGGTSATAYINEHKLDKDSIIIELIEETLDIQREFFYIRLYGTDRKGSKQCPSQCSLKGVFGVDHPHYGMKRSVESRRKMSEWQKGERNNQFGIMPWDHPSSRRNEGTIRMWSMMDEIYNFWLESGKVGYKTLEKKFGGNLQTMVKYFKREDFHELFSAWKEKYHD